MKKQFTKMIDKTAIIQLKIEAQSCKIKVGQNLNEEKKINFREIKIEIQNR